VALIAYWVCGHAENGEFSTWKNYSSLASKRRK
jgi:hypothetical protein